MPRDLTYLLHILISARRIVSYTHGLSWEQFMASGEKQDSVLHRISNIGEISKRISPDFKASNPAIPWKSMAGMRDRIIHDYYQIDWEVVWDTAIKSIPALICLLEPLVPPDDGLN
jgi:uncharacterized protein with HEPN domain